MKRVNQQAYFNYLFNGSKGFVLYTLYKDYENKINKQDELERKRKGIDDGNDYELDYFSIDENGFVPKAISTFSDYTGFEDDTIRKALKELESMGFVTSKKGDKEHKNITLYRPCFASSKYLQLTKQKLEDKMSAKNEKNRNQAVRILEPYIELLSKEPNFMKAIEMYSGTWIGFNNQGQTPLDDREII